LEGKEGWKVLDNDFQPKKKEFTHLTHFDPTSEHQQKNVPTYLPMSWFQ
jgi:hypothetical protein